MSQFDAEPVDLAPPPRERLSTLAVASLVMSLICCIPGFGAIGVLLGGIGVIAISRSAGRVRGMGLAITGIIIGLIVTLFWIALFVGGAIAVQQVADYERLIAGVQADDRQAIDAWLTPGAETAATDAQIDEFRAAYESEYGAFIGVPDNIADLFEGYLKLGDGIPGALQSAEDLGYDELIPLPAYFGRGGTIVIVAIDDDVPGPSGLPAVENIGILAPDGSMIWLIDPPAGSP